ncbi:MAG: O-antigen ligase family protein [Leptospiraceae bacterium]|nr:O-antigen ligase family protein [Leptospiraceae bacterium]
MSVRQATWGMLFLVMAILGAIIALLLVGQVARMQFIRMLGYYWTLALPVLIYEFRRSKSRYFRLLTFLASILGLSCGIALKAIPLGDPAGLRSTDSWIPLMLVAHLGLLYFAVWKRWPARQFFAYTAAFLLSACFMDAFFWLGASAFLLPIVLSPALNFNILVRSFRKNTSLQQIALVLFLIIALISAIVNPGIFYYLRGMALLLPGAVLTLGIRSRFLQKGILFAFVLSAFIYALHWASLGSDFFTSNFAEINPNRTAAYFSLAAVFVAANLIGDKSSIRVDWRRGLISLGFLISMGLLFVLESAGAMIATFYGLSLVLFIRLFPKKYGLARLGIVMPVLLAIVLPWGAAVNDFVGTDSARLIPVPGHGRDEVWQGVYSIIKESDFRTVMLGNGYGSSDVIASASRFAGRPPGLLQQLAVNTGGINMHSHNLLLELILSTGVLGFIAFLLVVSARIFFAKPEEIRISGPILAAFFMHGAVDMFLDIPAITFFLWLGIFLRPTTAPVPNTGRVSGFARGFLATAVILSTIFCMAQIRAQVLSLKNVNFIISAGQPLNRCLGAFFKESGPEPSVQTQDIASPPYKVPYMVAFTDPSLLTIVASEYLYFAEAGINRAENLKLAQKMFAQCVENTHFHPMCQYGLGLAAHRMGEYIHTPVEVTDPFHLSSSCPFATEDNGFKRTIEGWEISNL